MFELLIAATVLYVGVAHAFQHLFGGFGTAAAAAVEVDGGVFIGNVGGDLLADLVVRNILGVFQMACGIFFGRAHVDPHGFLAGGGLARLALLLGRLAAVLAVGGSSNWEGGQKGDSG